LLTSALLDLSPTASNLRIQNTNHEPSHLVQLRTCPGDVGPNLM
jgi:hypothetical protein